MAKTKCRKEPKPPYRKGYIKVVGHPHMLMAIPVVSNMTPWFRSSVAHQLACMQPKTLAFQERLTFDTCPDHGAPVGLILPPVYPFQAQGRFSPG